MTGTVRLGFVGCGAITSLVHLRSARAFRDVEVVGLADPSRTALELAARLAPHAPHYRSVDELLAGAAPDAIVVATPSGTHAEIASAVIDAGTHVYLEKPIATDVPSAEALAVRAGGVDVVAAIGFNRRFHPAVVEARRLLGAAAMTTIAEIRTVFAEPLEASSIPVWKRHRNAGGGAPLDLASHHVDLIRFLLGAEVEAVGGELRSVSTELDDGVLAFRAGACRAVVDCSFIRPRADRVTLEDDTGRTMEIDRVAGRLMLDGRPVSTMALAPTRIRAVLRPGSDPSYRPALRAFVDRVQGRPCELPSLAVDGLASLRAVVRAEELALGSAT